MTAIIHIILIVDISYTNCPFKKCQELRELEEYAVVGEEFISILKKIEIDLSRRMLRISMRFSDTNLSKMWIVSFSNVSSLQDKNALSVIGKGSDFIFDSISAPLVQKSSFSLIDHVSFPVFQKMKKIQIKNDSFYP